jgi:hypothetical protein
MFCSKASAHDRGSPGPEWFLALQPPTLRTPGLAVIGNAKGELMLWAFLSGAKPVKLEHVALRTKVRFLTHKVVLFEQW